MPKKNSEVSNQIFVGQRGTEVLTRGLVPSSAPLFVDEVLAPWTKEGVPVKTVNNIIYADMLETLVKPAVMNLYPAGDCLFQDDEAKIHRIEHVSTKAAEMFKNRILPKMASHTADLYPVENLWSILKDDVSKNAPIKRRLKKIISTKSKYIHSNKVFLKIMMSSVPARLHIEGCPGSYI